MRFEDIAFYLAVSMWPFWFWLGGRCEKDRLISFFRNGVGEYSIDQNTTVKFRKENE